MLHQMKVFVCFIFCFQASFSQVSLIKGPYLQVGTPNSVTVKWETDVPSNTKIEWGTSVNSLTSVFGNFSNVTSHEVNVTALSPGTKYYYRISTYTQVLQGDSNNYFITSPVPGTPGKYRFWVTGDCGNASTNQINVRDQYLNYNSGNHTDGWLLLGDNAYFYGSDAEYNAEFFSIYQGSIMKNALLWPAPGNHDYNNGATTATTVPYYTIFTTPTNAQAGGVASGTEAYYSFNYGNIHFISLDSYGTTGASQKMYDTTGAQAVWLKQDLAANNKFWTVAYWHHPPYTMGSHNSDTELDLVAVRQDFIRILERYHVDLIMCGHSHDYERSKLMKGHYGNEASFNASVHHLDPSSARNDGSPNSCPYLKDTINQKSGTVYVVAGSAGQLGGQQASFPHDAMYYSNSTDGGSLILDIEKNKLEGKWLCADGVIRDQFTIYKNVNRVTGYTVNPGQSVTLKASWPANHIWSNSSTGNSLTVNSFSNATYWVKDNSNCVSDTFKLYVLPAVNFSNTGVYCENQTLQFFDNSSNNPVTWQWLISPSVGININNPNAQNPLINFGAPGVYTVTLVSGNNYGQGIASSQTLVIYPKPIATYANTKTTICAGETITLTATGSSSYSWSTGQNTPVIAASPTVSTVYSTTFTSASNCVSTGSLAIAVNPCTGLNDALNIPNRIHLFPNPFNHFLNFETGTGDEFGIEFYNTSGRKVNTIKLCGAFGTMFPDIEPGVYFYRVYNKNGFFQSGKVIRE